MDIHKNARLTFVRREQLAESVILQGRTLNSAAADIKHLGRFTEVVVRSDGRRRGKHHRGWEYLHVAIDDHSRVAFSQVLPNFTGASAVAFLHAAVAYYATLGIRIRRLLTDNGHCYRSGAFREACLQLGIRHHFTRPYTPSTNGKAERLVNLC